MRPTLRRLMLAPLFLLLVAPAARSQELLHEILGTPVDHHLGKSVADLGDVNLDGHADFIVTSPEATSGAGEVGRYAVFSGKDGTALFQQTGWQPGGKLGYSARGLGDLDQDGHPDFIVGWPGQNGNGTATIHSGANGASFITKAGPAAGGMFGAFVDGPGDVDNDGVVDYLVSSPAEGSVRVFSGTTGALLQRWDNFNGMNFSWTLLEARGTGDVDQDGHGDVVIGEPLFGAANGRAIVVSGKDGSTIHSWTGDQNDAMGFSVAAPGDVDQDGVPDVLVGLGQEQVGVYFTGGARLFSGATGTPIYVFTGPNGQSAGTGRAVARAGDVNGDDVPDFLIGARYYDDVGATFLYSGATGGVLARFDGEPTGSLPLMGYSIDGGGDIDGDGLADILSAATGEMNDLGVVRAFAGNDLFLNVDQTPASLTFTYSGAKAQAAGALVLTEANGIPTFFILDAGTMGSDGERSITLPIVSGFSGLTFRFQAFAQKLPGVADSDAVDVTLP